MLPELCLVSPAATPLFYPELGGRHGGAELQLTLLARALVARGVSVTLVMGARGQPAEELRDGVRLLAYPHRPGLAGRIGLQKALVRARCKVYVARALGSTARDVAFHCWRTRRHFVYWIASDMDCEPGLSRRVGGPTRTPGFRWALRRADAIIAQHEGQQRMLRQHEKLASTVIHNALPARPAPGEGERPYHLFIGAAFRNKNPLAVLDLAGRHPAESFLWIGTLEGAPAALRARVERRLAEVRNVRRIERVEFDQIDSYFARARTLLVPSLAEGFPNTIVQALWHGVPIVSLNVDPGGMIAAHGLGVAAGGDEARWQEGFADLAESRLAWSAISRRCHEYAARELSLGRMAESFIELIERLG